MGNYRCRKDGFLPGWQINVANMIFQGYSDAEIIRTLWPEKVTDGQKAAVRKKLYNLKRDEKFQEYYRSLITEWSVHNVGKALTTLAKQMDDKNGWLANKACNDILTQSKQFTGNDENSVVVRVEGMPELGVPEE